MLRIELKEDKPGYALLSARKWKGSNEVEIAVQHSQNSRYLVDTQNWSPEIVWHRVPDLSVEGDALTGRIGPWLVDALLNQGGNVRFLMQVRDATLSDAGPIAFSGNILSSSAGGDYEREQNVREVVTPEPQPLVVEPVEIAEPVVETPAESAVEKTEEFVEPEVVVPPPTPAPEPKKSKLGLIIGLVVLLLAAAIAAYFLLQPKEEKPAPTECQVSSASDELSFIQTCLKTKPDNQKLLTIIDEAKKANKCSIAQRLYAHQAQSGNAEIALAYAKEYETGNACFKADKETAIYWYESVLSADPNNATAKQRLDELKK